MSFAQSLQTNNAQPEVVQNAQAGILKAQNGLQALKTELQAQKNQVGKELSSLRGDLEQAIQVAGFTTKQNAGTAENFVEAKQAGREAKAKLNVLESRVKALDQSIEQVGAELKKTTAPLRHLKEVSAGLDERVQVNETKAATETLEKYVADKGKVLSQLIEAGGDAIQLLGFQTKDTNPSKGEVTEYREKITKHIDVLQELLGDISKTDIDGRASSQLRNDLNEQVVKAQSAIQQSRTELGW